MEIRDNQRWCIPSIIVLKTVAIDFEIRTIVKTTEEKAESKQSSTNSKKDEILTEPQQEKKVSSTDTSEDNPKILAFRRELEEIALKHLGKVSKNTSTSTPLVNTGSESVNTGSFDLDDSPMPELEIFHNLPTEIEVSPTPTLRIHNIHPKSQILGDPKSAVQTRSKVQHKSGAHALFSFIPKQQRNRSLKINIIVYRNKRDERGVVVRNKARLGGPRVHAGRRWSKLLYGLHQAPRAWYATVFIILEKHGYKEGGLQVKRTRQDFISQDKYVAEILKKFDLVNVKNAITPMETKVALTKDEEAVDVDVHLYRSMIGHPRLSNSYCCEDNLLMIMVGLTLTGNPQHVVVNFLDKDLSHGNMTVDDLLQLVPQLMTRVDSLGKDLKQTKLTLGSAIVKLVKKVKKLEGILKRRNVVLSDSEEEELRPQGSKSR
ncbi:hypothetical protein Tco_0802880 [Tanacetum coccineum]|uniref:Reverse transcriptase Ty1/copia-type domain-containing protein n=1 Tax=Tanacetum coccineum TaxID=301880 RepID=A0ABQ5A0Z2_9ASTR